MNFLSRVVWSEGMYIGPHHFQSQNRYFEDSVQFATSALWPDNYGLLGCELDHEALRNGTVALLHARGIFNDGLLFKMPESDPLPAARDLTGHFPPDRDKLTIYLSVSARRPEGLNCSLTAGAANGTRFTAETRTVPDEVNSRDEKPVIVGRKNISLVLETEISSQAVTLPVARVLRSGSGHFIYDPAFIPPCLQIAASTRLMSLLQELIEILEEKSSALAGGGSSRNTGYSTGEIANFWLLHAVNSGLAPLRHICYSKRGHPDELYTELARLAGALCTFTLETHPRAIPSYDHLHPEKPFVELDRLLRTLIDTFLPPACLSIPLTLTSEYLYSGEIKDQRCLGDCSWIFAIRSPLPALELIQKTPELVKVCSEKFVPELVKRALPGLTLTHMPVPPRAISASAEIQYFRVDRKGPCWNHLVETRQVGVYVPGEFGNVKVEVFIVLTS